MEHSWSDRGSNVCPRQVPLIRSRDFMGMAGITEQPLKNCLGSGSVSSLSVPRNKQDSRYNNEYP